jgi:hypothetical protein
MVLLLGGGAMAAEIEVGREAPELRGGKWVTADGRTPELKGKVRVIDFWFAA